MLDLNNYHGIQCINIILHATLYAIIILDASVYLFE